MLIIFEGADNSGKTIIAKALARVIGYEYFKHSSQQNDFESIKRDKPIIEAEYLIDLLSQVELRKKDFHHDSFSCSKIPIFMLVFSQVFSRISML